MTLKNNINRSKDEKNDIMDYDGIYNDTYHDADMKMSIKPSDIWETGASLSYTQKTLPDPYSIGINNNMMHKTGIFSTGLSINRWTEALHRPSSLISKRGHSWCELIPDISDFMSPDDASGRSKFPCHLPLNIYSVINHFKQFELHHLSDISSFFNTVKCSSCNRLLFSFLTLDSDAKHPCCHKNHRLESTIERLSHSRRKSKQSQEHISTPLTLTRSISSSTKKKLSRSPPVLNLDKHCGVIISPSNLPCMRSLTCKSHSVIAKRAVSGRSKSYDELLAKHKLERQADKMSNSIEISTPSTKAFNTEHKKPCTSTQDPLMQLLQSNHNTPAVHISSFTAFGRSNFCHWIACGVNYSMLSNRRTTNFISSMHAPFVSSNDTEDLFKKTSKKKTFKKNENSESTTNPTFVPVTSESIVSYSMPDISFS